MLVYGDHSEQIRPRARLNEIAGTLSGGRLDHDTLTGSFIDLAGVAQAVADADFLAHGCDRPRPAEAALLEQLTALATVLLQSWDAGCTGGAGLPLPIPADLPTEAEARVPEGYAFYALRPEAYGLAARRLQLAANPRVIGLRSIGTGLACMAAAALNAPPPLTFRPVGDPWARKLRVAPEFERAVLAADCHFVIVDEGPGMSGSSFGAVADWLEERGVPAARIAFLPGHGNPLGPQASERHRQRWATAQRPVVPLDAPPTEWLQPLIGSLEEPLRDLSGGAWRTVSGVPEAEWPPVDPMWERRKFLARTAGACWLVKFAGLGRIGETKLQLARQVERAGIGPEVAGLTRGWLVTRWVAEATPARPSTAELLAYLSFRAAFPAPRPGASPDLLLAMVRRNVPGLAEWQPDLAALRPRPVCTDNRMAAHEWLRLPSGRLLKADALDHHAAHDLIGCQDIAWDLAGAAIELDLGQDDVVELATELAVDPKLLNFYRVAYAAFRIGAHRLSAASLRHDAEEQQRHLRAADHLDTRLAAVDAVEHLRHVDQPPDLRVEPLA